MTRGPHPQKKLFGAAVRAYTKPGRYADGNGLYLIVADSGCKRWMLRTVVQGRRRDIGLGGLSIVSLKDAREEAARMRKIARNGDDPLAERRRARTKVPTFKEAATQVHREYSKAWKNKKHAAQWINTLKTYAYPVLEDSPIDQVGTAEVMQVLSPIWLTKSETARRVRQRIGTVLDWAKAAGHRSGDNPIDGITKGLPRQPKQKGHHAALPYGDVSGFIDDLRETGASMSTKLAFEFLILTATRTSEVTLAKWSEINLDEKTWTVPAERMKAGRKFRVPLAARCVEILEQAKVLFGNSGYVFPGLGKDKPLSNNTFLKALQRMEKDITAHGFRSTFRDWAAERTNFSREVCEMALAHTVSNKVEAAYLRGDIFEKRRELMATWAAFVSYETSADVVTLRA